MGDQSNQSAGNSSEPRYDHIARVRSLVWSLKESLSNLLKIAASNIQHNSQIDSGLKATDDKVPRLDKALEDFYSIFNQIELHLKTIQECAIQQRQSQKYLPFSFKDKSTSSVKSESGFIEATGADHDISYGQYIHTIKGQISFIESLQKILLEGSKKIAPNE